MNNELNIAYSFDNNYAQHGGVSLISLFENNRDIEKINVYIIEDKLSEKNREKINAIVTGYGHQIFFLNLYELTVELPPVSFYRSSYGRLFLPKLTNIDRILYIDSDTIINSSLKYLTDLNMSDCLLAGVQDTVNRYYLELIGLNINNRYINGGIMIINLRLWRKLGITERCIDFILKFKGSPPHNDQGTVNYVCRNNIKIIPPNFNVMNPMFAFPVSKIKKLFGVKAYYTQNEINDAVVNPIIIHYTDEFFNRPWFINCTHPLKDKYIKYFQQSPWKFELPYKPLSKNCLIQNWIYFHCPFFIYRLMIKFIEFRHSVFTWTK
jgi:lipopolysaccharide biosynthesis glycosyltransferase